MEALKKYSDIKNDSLSLKQIVKILNITSKKEHLNENQFLNVIKLYNANKKYIDKSIEHYINGFKETIRKYPSVDDWNKCNAAEKILVETKSHSNVLYYYTMVIAKRIKVDIDILNSYLKIPRVLSDADEKKISDTLEVLKLGPVTQKILSSFKKLVIFSGKEINKISKEDFDSFSNNTSTDINKKIFFILKYWKNISDDAIFLDRGKSKRKYTIDNVNNKNKYMVDIYEKFKEYTFKTEVKATAWKKAIVAKRFIEWIGKVYPEIETFNELSFIHIQEYSNNLKESTSKMNNQYSSETINSELSRLKQGIIKYLFIEDKINEGLKQSVFGSEKYSDLFFDKVDSLPVPVSIKDRIAIENAIMKEDINNTDELYLDIIKLCYFLGLRPTEALCLKIDCDKGLKEVPSLHVHKAKGFKERYIPLIEEALIIVKKWQKINSDSLPVYIEYDGQTSKRLFQRFGWVVALNTIDKYFNNLMIKNNIVTTDKKSKYPLYILRKIRITTWLESGLSEDEVAYLVGHDKVDSHNNYIISKELRIVNARKVYDTYYKNFFNEVKSSGKYTEPIHEEFNKSEIDKLKDVLIEIENKNLNTFAKEEIIREFPEMILPLPCGSCIAKAYDGDYECEAMELPCLECDEFKGIDVELSFFDDFVGRLFISRNEKRKKGLDGLVMRIDTQIDRLKKFYIDKLGMTEADALVKFADIEQKAVVKRGRPKKK